MKQSAKILSLLLTGVLIATLAVASSGGNPKKGKYLYKKSCKSCHGDGTEGKKLTPLSKTQAQWNRFFEKDKHKDKADAWTQFGEQDLKDIQQFLFDHAADSDQPETCG